MKEKRERERERGRERDSLWVGPAIVGSWNSQKSAVSCLSAFSKRKRINKRFFDAVEKRSPAFDVAIVKRKKREKVGEGL